MMQETVFGFVRIHQEMMLKLLQKYFFCLEILDKSFIYGKPHLSHHKVWNNLFEIVKPIYTYLLFFCM